jgi:hypothetical protein
MTASPVLFAVPCDLGGFALVNPSLKPCGVSCEVEQEQHACMLLRASGVERYRSALRNWYPRRAPCCSMLPKTVNSLLGHGSRNNDSISNNNKYNCSPRDSLNGTRVHSLY